MEAWLSHFRVPTLDDRGTNRIVLEQVHVWPNRVLG
jgi:hypothetical protein